jgi:hypothetical protein
LLDQTTALTRRHLLIRTGGLAAVEVPSLLLEACAPTAPLGNEHRAGATHADQIQAIQCDAAIRTSHSSAKKMLNRTSPNCDSPAAQADTLAI